MGSIWLAEHLVLGTEVAVKLMARQWALMPSAGARFLREARMTATIDSPHVVRVLDCRLTESDEPYLVLELLRGENLEQRVRRHGAMPVFDVAEILSQLGDAIGKAHAAGIVHRDVKPENVFLEAGAGVSVKLLDFGVAKPKNKEECLDVDRLPAGTAQYMSPEHMFDPETTDERSDLFSLAAVAYFALTRRSPFDADSLEGLYFAIDGGTFKRPTELRPELPRSLDAWFERALAHDPAARFATAREMVQTFQDAIRGESAWRKWSRLDSPSSGRLPPSLRSIPGIRALWLPTPSVSATRRGVTVALVLAAAALLFAWHDGPKVEEAQAADPRPITTSDACPRPRRARPFVPEPFDVANHPAVLPAPDENVP